MRSKKLIGSFLSFAFTILLFTASIYAWFTLSSSTSVDEIVLNVTDLKADIKLEVKKNNGEFIELKTKDDFAMMFHNALPSNRFRFRLTIVNESSRETSLKIVLNDIYSDNVEEDYDMRNVFYIEDGRILLNNNSEIFLEPNNDVLDPIYEQELNLFNFNNLIINNDIVLLENYAYAIDEELVIEFIIFYDQNTSQVGYQTGKLNIGSINIYNN